MFINGSASRLLADSRNLFTNPLDTLGRPSDVLERCSSEKTLVLEVDAGKQRDEEGVYGLSWAGSTFGCKRASIDDAVLGGRFDLAAFSIAFAFRARDRDSRCF